MANCWAWERCLMDGRAWLNMSIKQSRQVWKPCKSDNQAQSHWLSQWRYSTNQYTHCHQQKGGWWGSKRMLQAWVSLEANCMFCNNRQAKHISPVKPCMRHHRTWSPWKASGQHCLEINVIEYITFSHTVNITHKKTCNLIWHRGMAWWLKDSSGHWGWFEKLQLPVTRYYRKFKFCDKLLRYSQLR